LFIYSVEFHECYPENKQEKSWQEQTGRSIYGCPCRAGRTTEVLAKLILAVAKLNLHDPVCHTNEEPKAEHCEEVSEDDKVVEEVLLQ
jgi:hypothetical protein